MSLAKVDCKICQNGHSLQVAINVFRGPQNLPLHKYVSIF